MKLFHSLFALTALVAGLVPSTFAQIVNYTPSKGRGVSYSVNVPKDTASAGSGPIYIQVKGPSHLKWIALGQGNRMNLGNNFIVYSGSGDNNVTLSPRRATGPVEPLYTPDIEAYLLDGSGISDGIMTANIRCDNCMFLHDGRSAVGAHSQWIWAATHGEALDTNDVSAKLYQHDWHGIFSLDLTKAVGGSSDNPFLRPESHSYMTIDYTSMSKQQQIDDTVLHKKRIAHGSLSAIAFVLLFPNSALSLYFYPSRRTVAWIHAPLQIFAAIVALGGLAVGASVSRDVQGVRNYHPIIGYIVTLGIVFVQPALGIVQHLRFRKTGKKTLFGLAHRYLGRFFMAFGIINGGLGFKYACTKTPDVPLAAKYSYGFIVGGQVAIYVLVIIWRRWRNKKSQSQAAGDSEAPVAKDLKDSQSPGVTFVSDYSGKMEMKTVAISRSNETLWSNGTGETLHPGYSNPHAAN